MGFLFARFLFFLKALVLPMLQAAFIKKIIVNLCHSVHGRVLARYFPPGVNCGRRGRHDIAASC